MPSWSDDQPGTASIGQPFPGPLEEYGNSAPGGFHGAEPTGLPPHSTHWCRHGLAEPEPPIKGLALRFAGLWGSG